MLSSALTEYCIYRAMDACVYVYMQGSMHGAVLLLLGILGQCHPVYPYVECSSVATVLAVAIHACSSSAEVCI